MQKIQIILFLLFSIVFRSGWCQVSEDLLENNMIFATVNGMKNDNPLIEKVKFEIKFEGENYLEVERFTDLSTGKRFNDIFNIWGIRYNGEYYFHLAYAPSFEGDGLKKFIKINKDEIDNNFLVFSINCKVSEVPPKTPSETAVDVAILVTSIVSSLSGDIFVIIPSEIKLGKEQNWLKESGEWAYIYYIETNKSLDPKAKTLTKKRLKKLYPKNKELHKRIDNKEVLYTEALKLVKSLNNK